MTPVLPVTLGIVIALCKRELQKLARAQNQWYHKNKTRVCVEQMRVYRSNPEKFRSRNSAYKKANKAKLRAQQRAYEKERHRSDPEYKLRKNIQRSILLALKRPKNSEATSNFIGCSYGTLKARLESLWLPGMSWANYGKDCNGWVIDHIKPIASFDMSDDAQAKACYHFTNLQPLWWGANREKADKIDAKYGNQHVQAL